MESPPYVSVIIPNYNHARYLKDRIDSVLNQTYQNFEVIILDDCSTDDSKEIIESYKNHPRISRIVYNEVNSGSTFKQWQKGFSLASGEYIWIAESDDIASPDFISKLLKSINGNKNITIAASAITLINDSGQVIGYESISGYKKQRYYSGKDFIKENMFLGNHILNASSVIFRRDALNDLSQKFSTMRASGDYMFWIELANKGNVIELPDRLDYFRRSSATVTSRLYSSGVAFEEARMVYSRLQELGFLNFYFRHVIIGFRLWQIVHVAKFNSENIREHCLAIWKTETTFPILDIMLSFSHGICRKLRRFMCNIF